MKKISISLATFAFLLTSAFSCKKGEELTYQDKGVVVESSGSAWSQFLAFGGSEYEGQVIIQTSSPSHVKGNNAVVINGNISDENFDHIPQGNLEFASQSWSQTSNDEWNAYVQINGLGGTTRDIDIYDPTNSQVDYSVSMYFPIVLEAELPRACAVDSVIKWNADASNSGGLILRITRNINNLGRDLTGGKEFLYVEIPDDDGYHKLTSSDLSGLDSGDEYVRLTLFRGNYALDSHRKNSTDCAFFYVTNVTRLMPVL